MLAASLNKSEPVIRLDHDGLVKPVDGAKLREAIGRPEPRELQRLLYMAASDNLNPELWDSSDRESFGEAVKMPGLAHLEKLKRRKTARLLKPSKGEK